MKESRSLFDLEPGFRDLIGEWLRLCAAEGVAVLVYCTTRPSLCQDELYAQGRTAPGPIVTNAKGGQSPHNYGLAVDAAPWEWIQDQPGGVYHKELDWTPFQRGILDPRWSVMVDAAAVCGLEWAGNWKTFKEYVHFQHPGWKELANEMPQLRV